METEPLASKVLLNPAILQTIAHNICDIKVITKLAGVCRLFYHIFTGDETWTKFDVYEVGQGIFNHFKSNCNYKELGLIGKAALTPESRYTFIYEYAQIRGYATIFDEPTLRKVLKITQERVSMISEFLKTNRHYGIEFLKRLFWYEFGGAYGISPWSTELEFLLEVLETEFPHEMMYKDCKPLPVVKPRLYFIRNSLKYHPKVLMSTAKTGVDYGLAIQSPDSSSFPAEAKTDELIRTAIYHNARFNLGSLNDNPDLDIFGVSAQITHKETTESVIIFETPHKDPQQPPLVFKLDKYYETFNVYCNVYAVQDHQLVNFGWVLWNNPDLLPHFDWVSDQILQHLALVVLQRTSSTPNGIKLVPPHLFDDFDFALKAIWYNEHVLKCVQFKDPQLRAIVDLYNKGEKLKIRKLILLYAQTDESYLFTSLADHPRWFLDVECCTYKLGTWLGHLSTHCKACRAKDKVEEFVTKNGTRVIEMGGEE